MQTVIVVVIALPIIALLIVQVLGAPSRKRNLGLPYLSFQNRDESIGNYAHNSLKILRHGYDNYSKRGLPFAMLDHTDVLNPMVVLPMKYLEEVRSASTSKLSFNAYLNKLTVAKETGAPMVTDLVSRIVRQDLNKSINELIQPLQQACMMVLGGVIPNSPDWIPIPGHTLLLAPISHMLARVFVGSELWANPEWHGVLLSGAQAYYSACSTVRDKYPPSLRWLAKYLNNDVKAVYAARRRGEALLKPLIEARILDAQNRASNQKSGYTDAIQWLINAYRAEKKPIEVDQIMQDEAFLVAASLESVTFSGLSMLFDLIARPDCIAELREEISQVYAEYGRWNRQSLDALRMMDSFLKESQRLNTHQYMTMQRQTMGNHSFKDGLTIPKGTAILMPTRYHGIDPDVVPNAKTFDAKRWKRLRDQQDPTKFHLASVQEDMLPWGSGPNACPGRFLVQQILKIVFAHLLTTYDMKFADGSTDRPPNAANHTSSVPDTSAVVLLKAR